MVKNVMDMKNELARKRSRERSDKRLFDFCILRRLDLGLRVLNVIFIGFRYSQMIIDFQKKLTGQNGTRCKTSFR